MPSFRATVHLARRVQAGVACLCVLLVVGACRPTPDTGFSLQRAEKHVRMLATAFGSRPAGSDANTRTRDYAAAQLRHAGFEIRLQETVATSGSGVTTPVVNIVATRQGRQGEAVALVSHYDTVPESRGAADDGLGVAVCLEAARVLAARTEARYTLLVALTDGEELGMMGARALREAPEFSRVRAFLNFEAIGTNGPARLFQAGPGNSWLTAVWAASAPFPAGSSVFTEVYRRLPNDTDFTILSRSGPPGLNFAPSGNTFAYHTRLDTPARLESATVERLGHTVVRLVEALDRVEIGRRTPDDGTFFDVAGRVAFSYSNTATRVLAVIVFVLGLLATCKAFLAARAEVGSIRLVVTAAWALLGTGALFGALALGCHLLSLGTGLPQPWYGQAGVLLVFLLSVGLGAVWLVILLGRSLPVTVRPSGHPSCVWVLALPVWAGLLGFLQRAAPGTGYLFAFPLLAASVLVLASPVRNQSAGRLISGAAGFVAVLLWAPLVWPLLEFLVGLFGRSSTSAPVWLFPAASVALISTMGPSLAGLVLGRQGRFIPPSAVTSLLLLAIVASGWIIAVEPAYTAERPERRALRYVQDMLQQRALWEAGTQKQTLAPAGTDPTAPRDWRSDAQAPAVSVRLSTVSGLFRYRTRAAGLVAPPLDVRNTTQPVEGSTDVWLEATAVPLLEGTGVAFMLPPGVTPSEASLRGVVRDGRWRAVAMPAPASGVTLRVRLPRADLSRLSDARVLAIVHGVPGGVGWQRLPPWLPQDTVVWSAESWFILPWPAPVQPPAAPVLQ
jgi:hypothetical protein